MAELSDLFEAASADNPEFLGALLEMDPKRMVDRQDDLGRTLLHIAASTGSEKTVRLLIDLGANANKTDVESRWTPLHRALYNHHLRVALLLIRAGAVLGDELTPWHHGRTSSNTRDQHPPSSEKKTAVDKDGFTPLSLLSWRLRDSLRQATREGRGGDVFTFGKADYQLGYLSPKTADVQKPRRIEAMGHLRVLEVAAARHHSVALTCCGQVYTWGHGRGGRLGHGDEVVQPFPKLMQCLSGIHVVTISAAENHTVAVTVDGFVYTWGSDRYGQLGQGSGDKKSRLMPRRVEALRRSAVVGISAAATHTACITAQGEVYTFGGNEFGQLGYTGQGRMGDGVPRPVTVLAQRMSGKDSRRALQVSAGCRCTLVLIEGSRQDQRKQANKVYQWGWGSHNPVRVDFRPAEKAATGDAKSTNFWVARPGEPRIDPQQVAAAQRHNVARDAYGLVYTWGLGADQLGSGSSEVYHVASPQVVKGMDSAKASYLSASADHTCVVTDTGDLYTWGSSETQLGVLGHGHSNWQPIPRRVVGLKRAVKVAAGPEHTIVLSSPSIPPLPCPEADISYINRHLHKEGPHCSNASRATSPESVDSDENPEVPEMFTMDLSDEELSMSTLAISSDDRYAAGADRDAEAKKSIAGAELPTLKAKCERLIAGQVDIWNAISVLAHAEALDGSRLAVFTAEYIRRNLDAILVSSRAADLDFLLEEEADPLSQLLEHKSAAPGPSSGPAEAEGFGGEEVGRSSALSMVIMRVHNGGSDPTLEEAIRLDRGARKKVTQIEELIHAQANGTVLSREQLLKVEKRKGIEEELHALQPILGKLRVIEAARRVREKQNEQILHGTTPDDFTQQQLSQVQQADKDSDPPPSFVCDVCSLMCANARAWEEHLAGRRHAKRKIKVEADQKVAREAAERQVRLSAAPETWPRALHTSDDPDVIPSALGTASPTSSHFLTTCVVNAVLPPARPVSPIRPSKPRSDVPPPSVKLHTPRKSFKELMVEEQAAAAARASSRSNRSSSGSIGSLGKSPGSGLIVGSLGTTSNPQDMHNRRLSLSNSTATAHNIQARSYEDRESSGMLLSAFIRDLPSKARSQAAEASSPSLPTAKPTTSTPAIPWAQTHPRAAGADQNGSIFWDAAIIAESSRNAKERQKSCDGLSGSGSHGERKACESISMEAIMAEEEQKTMNKRFSGNNCPWFTERKEHRDSLEAIQTKQHEEALAEAEARAVKDAIAVSEREERGRKKAQEAERQRKKCATAKEKRRKAVEAAAAAGRQEQAEKTPRKVEGDNPEGKMRCKPSGQQQLRRRTRGQQGGQKEALDGSAAEGVSLAAERRVSERRHNGGASEVRRGQRGCERTGQPNDKPKVSDQVEKV